MRRACVLLLALAGCFRASSSLSARDQALVDAQGGHPERAIPVLDSLAAAAPRDLSLARARVEAYVKAGRTDELVAALVREEARGPSAVNYYMQGLARFARAAEADPAVANFRQAIALEPKEPEFHYRLGLAYLESERYEAALPPLEEAARLAPEKEGYALPLAQALSRAGRRPEAVEALRRVVGQSPTPEEVATARRLMDAIEDPLADVPKAAKARVDEGVSWLSRAEVPQQAIVSFEDVLHDYPDLAGVHALLGLAFLRIDDAGQALDELKRAIQLAPADGRNQLYLGEVYASHQRTQAARECFERAIRLNPLLDEAYARLGDDALERRDLPNAQTYFRTLTLLEPDAVPARGKLALALQEGGDLPAASRELHRVVDKDPENVEFLLRLGLVEATRAKQATRPGERDSARDEAIKWLREVLKRQPDNAPASRALEMLKP